MKRLVKYLGVTAAVVSAGCLFAMASDTPNIGAIRQGEVYRHSDIWKDVDSVTIGLPGPIEPTVSAGSRETGPISMSPSKSEGSLAMNGGASAIPGGRGGSAMTAIERTNLSVKKAIRNLG